MLTRRTLLRTVGLALSSALPRLGTAAPLTTTQIANALVLIRGGGGNVLALPTRDGTVLVDSGAASTSEELLATTEKLSGAGIRALFNTHWHHDQIGANAVIGRRRAAIIAHEKTRLRLATGYYLPDEDRYESPVALEAQPTESFYTQGEKTVGGQKIDYGYLLEAHTDGDCYVYFRSANVIAVGDVVSPERDPELDWFGGGWLGGRVDALDLLLKLTDANTIYVPSYGSAVARRTVQTERDMLLGLFETFVDLVRKGNSAEDIVATGAFEKTGRTWTDPLKFARAAHKSLWAHHNTLSPDVV